MDVEVQTRDENGELIQFNSIETAMIAAYNTPSIWKISFESATGERVRLIREESGWIYETIYGERFVNDQS